MGSQPQHVVGSVPRIYLAVALPLTLGSALFVPPNQVPDEMTHLYRAAQFTTSHWYGERPSEQTAGGRIDAGLVAYQHAVDGNASERAAAGDIVFAGQLAYAHFPNTVRYAPVLYVPAALTLGVGRTAGATVEHAFYAARLVNAVVAVLIATWALVLARRGQLLLMALALLPMAAFEMGSLSQDGILVALALLLTAMVTRIETAETRHYWLMAGLIGVMAAARYPLIALVPLLILGAWRCRPISWEHRVAAPLLVVLVVAAWALATRPLQATMRPGVPASIVPQLNYLSQTPGAWCAVFMETLRNPGTNWLKTFIGVLGWLTVPLSRGGYFGSYLALGAAVITCVQEPNRLSLADRGLCALAAVGSFMLMMLATYLTWTPVGAPRVEGIQGRYFFGFAPLAAVILPYVKRWPWRGATRALLAVCVVWMLGDAVKVSLHAWNGRAPIAYPR